jgi:hypothetical protein
MPGGTVKFLRAFPSGPNLYYRQTAVNGSWRRIPGITDEEYLSHTVGGRVEQEAPNQVAKIEAKTGKKAARVVIE